MATLSALPGKRATTAAALGLALALSGCKTGPSAPPTDDASLNAAVNSRLQSDPGLVGQPLQVSVSSGVATLTGHVDSAAARSLAANDVSQIPGIRTVLNNLALGVPPTTPAAIVTPPPAPVAPLPAKRPTVAKVIPPKPIKLRPEPPPPAPAPIDRREPEFASVQPPPPPPEPARRPELALPAAPAPPAARNITLSEGTTLPVRITQTLDSETAQVGNTFAGALASDVIVDGIVVLPAGTRVNGHVDDAKDATHFSGNSILAVSLNSISRRGETIQITTDTFSKEGKGRGKNTAEKIGGGAAVGAILGGILGGGKGAAIGAASGGGLGAGVNAVTKGQQVQIESETLIRFRLSSSIIVRVQPSAESEGANDLQRRPE